MGLRRNKRGVEALPLRYIIIALVAALVIGIALQFVGVLRSGTINTAGKINDTLTEKTTCELDEEEPVITLINESCGGDDLSLNIEITDDCGVDSAGFFTNVTDDTGYDLDMENGIWTYSGNNTEWDNQDVTITVWSVDKATVENKGTETFTVECD